MGLAYATIDIENLFTQRALAVTALVDSGAIFLSIPQQVALQLGFDIHEVATREVILSNGQRHSVPMVGPLRVRFADRYCDLSALVLGDETLLGAVPMKMMDLVVTPSTQSLSVNPQSPHVPTATAKLTKRTSAAGLRAQTSVGVSLARTT
jgi:clan AA aspartic protease